MGDVLIGPGTLYRAPVAEANPDESTVAWGTAWGGNWVDMGDFPEGTPIALSLAEEIYKGYSEQTTSVGALSRTKRDVMVKGALLELSIANMEIALQTTADTTAAAGGGQKGYSDLDFGSQSDVTLYKWGIEALRVDSANVNQPIRWFLHKGFFQMTGDIQYSKMGQSFLPFTITLVGDSSKATAVNLGTLQIVTAQATAT